LTAASGSCYEIRSYTAGDRDAWNAFVRQSKNGTFLFLRDYMDYHAEYFTDHSLIVLAKNEIVALLPANRIGDEIHSHQGLTYGGLLTSPQTTTPAMLDLFASVVIHLAAQGFSKLNYKTIPWIYHRLPAEEDRYALFCLGAELVRRDVLSVVATTGESGQATIQTRRRRGATKAVKRGIKVTRSDEWARFWSLLTAHLKARFGVRPVHGLDEIDRLRRRFPDNIKLYLAMDDSEPVAGTVIYESARVAHVQYIASSEEGRNSGALDKLFLDLLGGDFATKPFFDFGISGEDGGRRLNLGLIEQKEGFGGRAVVHDFYRLTL
jgi:Acetyltransferase (GNAT) domain